MEKIKFSEAMIFCDNIALDGDEIMSVARSNDLEVLKDEVFMKTVMHMVLTSYILSILGDIFRKKKFHKRELSSKRRLR